MDSGFKVTSRRDFIKKAGVTAAALPFFQMPIPSQWAEAHQLDVHIFSKHLQFLDYRQVGEIASELGFSGVDLTVRPGGHVLPESVKKDLKLAVAEIKEGGSNCDMITTSVESVNNSLDMEVLREASSNGISYYRTNWFKYKKDQDMEDTLNGYRDDVKKLGELNKKLGIIGCYQNHAGRSIGASYWEIKKLMETVDGQYFGTQYDIRHAMVEAGLSWENGLQLLYPHIKTIVLKDFKWGKVNGIWKPINTPIGEGMVDFKHYFKLLKSYNLRPPVSMHLEYELGGAEKGADTLKVDKKVVFQAMKQDLKSIQKLWLHAK
jgi:sugar phosphate isomerase/epimerase